MIELRTVVDLNINRAKIIELPIEVQEQIEEVLESLDENYGIEQEREYTGSKVVVLENEQDGVEIQKVYDFSDAEFMQAIETAKGNYIYTLIISSTEINIAIFGEKQWIDML